MPPLLRAVTVTACLAASLLHLRHMMQEDVRLLVFTSLSLEHCVGVCKSVCACMFQCVSAHRRCVWEVDSVEWASIVVVCVFFSQAKMQH